MSTLSELEISKSNSIAIGVDQLLTVEFHRAGTAVQIQLSRKILG